MLAARHVRTACAVGALAAALAAVAAPGAARADDGWSFAVSPYLWVPGVSGSVTTRFPDLPEPDVEGDFGDLFSSLDGVGLMGAAEARYGRLGLVLDGMWISLGADVSTGDVLLTNGDADLDIVQGGLLGLWRVLESDTDVVDLGGGARGWAFDTDVTFDTAVGDRTVSPSWDTAFVVPVAAARWHHRFGEAWAVSAYGDVGGSGSRFTWQGLVTVDWAVAGFADLRAGWRHQYLDFQGDGRELDLSLSGPILGVTFHW